VFDPPIDREIGEYSTGNKQKLALVLAFMHDPDLVIMDEPTSGLDPLMQERLYEFIEDEKARGTTFFFSSHVLSEVRKVCDRVGIIRNGELVAMEGVEELLDRSGKRVHVSVEETLDPADFALAGVHDLDAGDGDASFMFTGEYDDLLDHLRNYRVRDLEIEEAPLEDVFMKFYDDGPESESVAPETAAATAGGESDA
jgi:ABC-2 type transport system ATP-binding protein